MGKKGFSRKAFLKPNKVSTDVESEDTPSQPNKVAEGQQKTSNAAVQDPSNEQPQAANDPSNRFLVTLNDEEKTTDPVSAGEDKESFTVSSGVHVDFSSNNGETSHEGETRGQMLQRHKKEAKSLKDTAKKMGKKRRDEAEELEQSMESRHRKEIEDWEKANPDPEAEKDTTVLSTTSGLYDLKIGADEEKDVKKPSKAQKRREQRAAEEAQREARIAEEQASVGPSEREVEAAELRSVLEPEGLQLVEIPPDGNCMYRAIEHQLGLCGEADEHDHQQLREEAASYIRAFPKDFYPFIVQESPGEDQGHQLEAYCCEIEETAKWGGQVELQALAQALEKQILVYSVGMPVVNLGQEYKGTSQPLRVCYLRHAYGLGEHYNSTQQVSPR